MPFHWRSPQWQGHSSGVLGRYFGFSFWSLLASSVFGSCCDSFFGWAHSVTATMDWSLEDRASYSTPSSPSLKRVAKTNSSDKIRVKNWSSSLFTRRSSRRNPSRGIAMGRLYLDLGPKCCSYEDLTVSIIFNMRCSLFTVRVAWCM